MAESDAKGGGWCAGANASIGELMCIKVSRKGRTTNRMFENLKDNFILY